MTIGLLDHPSHAAAARRLDLASPQTLAETGLSEDLIEQLVVKLLHFNADVTGAAIAERLGLEFAVIAPVLEQLKASRQCEVIGGGTFGAPSFRYRITDQGRRRAQLFLEHNQYVGAAPVPLSQYREYMAEFRSASHQKITPASVRQAVSHLVLSDGVVNQIGPAVTSGQSMFVYGPPGNGKTVIAQSLHNLLAGTIAIPHALEVEGHIIKLYNPINHQAVAEADTADALAGGARLDRRWVICRRPKVMAGGEMTMQSLDLAYSTTTGFYNAPIQLMANGGLLVIDDFGRQACSPREMLNRWIVPLETRIDFLTLQSGQQFEVAFDVLLVFATNIKPSELVDEAFLRRIQYKIAAENPTAATFAQIFENCCRERGLVFEATLVDLVVDECLARGIPLRGCQPRDLIDRALAQIEYLGMPHRLTPALMEDACASYFVRDQEE